jgi:hypothetical protein
MNRRLNQNTRRGAADASAKPNLAEREKLDRILQRVGNHMTVDEIDILYRCGGLFILRAWLLVTLPRQIPLFADGEQEGADQIPLRGQLG